MNICVISIQLRSSLSGIGYYTRMLADGLVQHEHYVTLVVPEPEVPPTVTSDWQVIPFRLKSSGSTHADWLRMAPLIAREVKRLSTQHKFDLLYFTQARDALLCRHSSFDGPIVGGVHDYYFADAPFSPFGFRGDYVDWTRRWLYYQLVRLSEWVTYRRLDGLVFNSRGTQEKVAASYRLSNLEQTVCYYGIQNGTETILGKYHKEPIILFVGGNLERKGLPTLLRALPEILRQHPEYKLVVVGDYANRKHMVKMATAIGVQDRVLFVGYQTNDVVRIWHQRAKVFIMPSLMEGFGIVFLEAMRAGTPVIATRVGGIPEVVVHRENGLLVSPNKPEELAESCIRLLSDPDLYNRLALGARNTVHKYPPEAMVRATEKFFQKVTAQWHT